MSEFLERFDKELDGLRQLRDETEVRLHLAGAEARDQWEKLEKGWQHLEGRAKVIGKQSQEVAGGIGETLEILAEQLKDGYHRIKKLV